MASKTLRSIKGRVMRVTRLDDCCNPVADDELGYAVSAGFVSITLGSEEEEGEEYTQKNAWGDFCVSEKDATRVKWVNVAIEFCEVDPCLLEVIGGANPIVVAGETVGATFGQAPNPNSFALEVWTKMAGSDACLNPGALPEWGYFVVPCVKNGKLDGDITIENGPLTMSLAGEGQPAAAWAEGPYGDAPLGGPFPEGDLWGISITTVQPPEPTDGCGPIPAPGQVTATAGSPGSFTGTPIPADAAGATSGGVVASPATAWTSGQYVQGSTAGAAGEMTWDGSAWVAGRTALAGTQSGGSATGGRSRAAKE